MALRSPFPINAPARSRVADFDGRVLEAAKEAVCFQHGPEPGAMDFGSGRTQETKHAKPVPEASCLRATRSGTKRAAESAERAAPCRHGECGVRKRLAQTGIGLAHGLCRNRFFIWMT